MRGYHDGDAEQGQQEELLDEQAVQQGAAGRGGQAYVDPYAWERPLDAVNRDPRRHSRLPPGVAMIDPFGFSLTADASPYDLASLSQPSSPGAAGGANRLSASVPSPARTSFLSVSPTPPSSSRMSGVPSGSSSHSAGSSLLPSAASSSPATSPPASMLEHGAGQPWMKPRAGSAGEYGPGARAQVRNGLLAAPMGGVGMPRGMSQRSKLSAEVDPETMSIASTSSRQPAPASVPSVPTDSDYLNSKLYQRTLKAQKALEKERAKAAAKGKLSRYDKEEASKSVGSLALGAGLGAGARRGSVSSSRPPSIMSAVGVAGAGRRFGGGGGVRKSALGWFRSASEAALPLSTPAPSAPQASPPLPRETKSTSALPTAGAGRRTPSSGASSPSGMTSPLPPSPNLPSEETLRAMGVLPDELRAASTASPAASPAVQQPPSARRTGSGGGGAGGGRGPLASIQPSVSPVPPSPSSSSQTTGKGGAGAMQAMQAVAMKETQRPQPVSTRAASLEQPRCPPPQAAQPPPPPGTASRPAQAPKTAPLPPSVDPTPTRSEPVAPPPPPPVASAPPQQPAPPPPQRQASLSPASGPPSHAPPPQPTSLTQPPPQQQPRPLPAGAAPPSILPPPLAAPPPPSSYPSRPPLAAPSSGSSSLAPPPADPAEVKRRKSGLGLLFGLGGAGSNSQSASGSERSSLASSTGASPAPLQDQRRVEREKMMNRMEERQQEEARGKRQGRKEASSASTSSSGGGRGGFFGGLKTRPAPSAVTAPPPPPGARAPEPHRTGSGRGSGKVEKPKKEKKPDEPFFHPSQALYSPPPPAPSAAPSPRPQQQQHQQIRAINASPMVPHPTSPNPHPSSPNPAAAAAHAARAESSSGSSTTFSSLSSSSSTLPPGTPANGANGVVYLDPAGSITVSPGAAKKTGGFASFFGVGVGRRREKSAPASSQPSKALPLPPPPVPQLVQKPQRGQSLPVVQQHPQRQPQGQPYPTYA
ncbi:hypothetical protein JCM10213v2_003060 [Rhodosporidiobolus nylandii]